MFTLFNTISYNSRGSNVHKLKYINKLLSESSKDSKVLLCAIQEHFLLRPSLYKIQQGLDDWSVLVKPAYKCPQRLDNGRPAGGLALIFPKFLKKHITQVKCENWRIQSVIVNINEIKHLFINCYFPVDTKQMGIPKQELLSCLGDISFIIDKNNFNKLVILGDLNYDDKK